MFHTYIEGKEKDQSNDQTRNKETISSQDSEGLGIKEEKLTRTERFSGHQLNELGEDCSRWRRRSA